MPNLQIHKTVAANNCYLKMGIVNNFIPKLIVLLSKVLNILKDFNLLLVFLALFLLFVLVINNSLIWFCLSNHYPWTTLVSFAHLLTSKLHCDFDKPTKLLCFRGFHIHMNPHQLQADLEYSPCKLTFHQSHDPLLIEDLCQVPGLTQYLELLWQHVQVMSVKQSLG